MAMRYRKSINLGGGVRLNLNKKSIGLSAGGKGMRYSVNSSGRRMTTLGLPGSGLRWQSSSSGAASAYSAGSERPRPATRDRPGLFAPRAEKQL